MSSDDFRDVSEHNALFRNPMKPGPRRSLLECKPKKMRCVEPVHSGPAIESVASIRRNTLFTCHVDQQWHEAVIAVSMDCWREAHHRHMHALGCHGKRGLFRSDTRQRRGAGSGHAVLDRKQTWRKERGSGRDDQGPVRASKRGTENLDGVPIDFAVSLECRKVMDERGVNHAIRRGSPTSQAVQVFKIAWVRLGTSGGKHLRGRI